MTNASTGQVEFLSATEPVAKEPFYGTVFGPQISRTLTWKITTDDAVSYVALDVCAFIRPWDRREYIVRDEDLSARQQELLEWKATYDDEERFPTDEDADTWMKSNPVPLWYATGVDEVWSEYTNPEDPSGSLVLQLLKDTSGLDEWAELECAQEAASGHITEMVPGLIDPLGRRFLVPLP